MTNVNKIEMYVKKIMEELEIPFNDSTKDTPKRVAKMWDSELFRNRNNSNIKDLDSKMKTFENVGDNHSIITVKDIPFFSSCEHHFMPFMGKVKVSYFPDKKIVGLSKIPRIVDYFSKKPQLQERFNKEIGDYFFENVKPLGVIVEVYDVMHTCVTARGIEKMCSTDSKYSVFKKDLPIKEKNSLDNLYLIWEESNRKKVNWGNIIE